MGKSKFYAVRRGREGRAIYESWSEAQPKVHGFPGAQHKSFESREEAERWVNVLVAEAVAVAPDLMPPPPTPSSTASPPTSSTSNLKNKRKHEVISLISSDEPTPDDLPFHSLKRSKSKVKPVSASSGSISSNNPIKQTSWGRSSQSSAPTSSTSRRAPIVIDGSDDLEPPEDDLTQQAYTQSPFFFTTPPKTKPPSPLPQVPTPPLDDPQPLHTVTPLASTSTLPQSAPNETDAPTTETVDLKVILSPEQRNLLDLAMKGHNVFYSGSAGTGKSVLLREMIRQLKLKHNDVGIHVTGSTGMAAVSIGGTTLHSFAALGLAKESQDVLLKKLQSPRGKKGRERWVFAKVLIIDEISMIDCRFFDKLDFVARHIRGRIKEPFGGLQIIATGDFFQLPPVTQGNVDPPYCFKARCFSSVFDKIHVLRAVFRQKDSSFVDLLNKMREGVVDRTTLKVFADLNRPLVYSDGIEATHLMSTKAEVASINETQLHKLEGNIMNFESIDRAPRNKLGFQLSMEEAKQKLDRNTIAESRLKLKLKAQVMLIKNLPDFGLVNGSRGIVLGFYTVNELVNLAAEGESVSIACDPRDQEQAKLDRKELAASRYFADEQAFQEHCADMYEASLQAQQSVNLPPSSQQGSSQAGKPFKPGEQLTIGRFFFNGQHSQQGHLQQGPPEPFPSAQPMQQAPQQKPIVVDDGPHATRWPVVKFARGVTLMVPPMSFEVQNGDGEVEAERQAVPLILAWALSIHKAQGQTIERLKVDLGSIFEKGQAYVAVSRATSLETLEVRNFRPRCVMSAPEVAQFYAEHT